MILQPKQSIEKEWKKYKIVRKCGEIHKYENKIVNTIIIRKIFVNITIKYFKSKFFVTKKNFFF